MGRVHENLSRRFANKAQEVSRCLATYDGFRPTDQDSRPGLLHPAALASGVDALTDPVKTTVREQSLDDPIAHTVADELLARERSGLHLSEQEQFGRHHRSRDHDETFGSHDGFTSPNHCPVDNVHRCGPNTVKRGARQRPGTTA